MLNFSTVDNPHLEASEKMDIHHGRKKVLLVGDSGSGKTTLLALFLKDNSLLRDPKMSIFCRTIPVNCILGKVNLAVYDTYAAPSVREALYSEVDCIILCFSVIDRDSATNAKRKWMPEIKANLKKNKKNTPILLVGTKIDKRQIGNPDHLTEEEGNRLGIKLKVHEYIESTNWRNFGVLDIFDTAAQLVIMPPLPAPRWKWIFYKCFACFQCLECV